MHLSQAGGGEEPPPVPTTTPRSYTTEHHKAGHKVNQPWDSNYSTPTGPRTGDFLCPLKTAVGLQGSEGEAPSDAWLRAA
ncbi:hypothetical protein R3I93_006769 [Phoxinus phoxinus]|uniref:Uncharacterized protein n=1 Tax=Phoxinus phoxinus TaxID=58324 RepID=A0AAN9DC43_9TELE